MPKVVFLDQGLRGEIPAGTTVLEAARRLGARLSSVCGGVGSCSTCRVEGVVHPESLSPVEELETAYDLPPGVRLACQARVLGDVGLRTVKIPKAVL